MKIEILNDKDKRVVQGMSRKIYETIHEYVE
jgi:hypothetical protein